MHPEVRNDCKAKMSQLRKYFEKMESAYSVKEDLDFDRDRGATFRFDPKNGGGSLLLRLDLEILQDHTVDDIVRFMENTPWQTLLSQTPEGKCLRFRMSGLEFAVTFCDL